MKYQTSLSFDSNSLPNGLGFGFEGELRARSLRCALDLMLVVTAFTLLGCTFSPPRVGPSAGEGPDAGAPADSDAGPIGEPARVLCQRSLAALSFDWEDGDQGWSHQRMPEVAQYSSNDWPFDDWERGAAVSGPGACRSGSGCWGTDLTTNYVTCQRAYLESPPMDLSQCADTDIEVELYQWYDFWTGRIDGKNWFDGGQIELSSDGGTSWQSVGGDTYSGQVLINPDIWSGFNNYFCYEKNDFHVHDKPGYVGKSEEWKRIRIAIPAESRTADVRIRFVYGSGATYPTAEPDVATQNTTAGWYLDDLRVQVQSE